MKKIFLSIAILSVCACANFDADDFLKKHPRNNTGDSGGTDYHSSSASSGGTSSSAKSGAVYVSALGSGTNSGLTKTSPLLSIQTAISLAKVSNFAEVCISGDFMLTNSFISLWNITNLTVSGGWDSNFTGRSNESVLNRAMSNSQVMYLNSCSEISLLGLALTGASNYVGVEIRNSTSININCTISNNHGTGYGGGMILSASSNCTIGGTIQDNSTESYGAGLCLYESSGNTITAKITGNTAGLQGGGIDINRSRDNIITGPVINNISMGLAGGIVLYSSTNTLIAASCAVTNNRCNTSGGGYYGGGISIVFNGTNYIQTGAIITNNYNGSAGTAQDNIDGSITWTNF